MAKKILAGLPFVGFLLISLNSWYMGDDWRYHFYFNGQDYNDAVPFKNFFTEIWSSLYNHWELWNGRVVAHFFVQGMMQLPHWMVAILMTAIFTGVVIMVNLLSNDGLSTKKLLFTSAVLFLYWPLFRSSFLWVSGVGNYSLVILCQMLYLFFGMKWVESQNWKMFTMLLVIAPFMGNFSEIAGPVTMIMLTTYAIIVKRTATVAVKVLLLDLAGIAGFMIMYLSPGTHLRSKIGDGAQLVNLVPGIPEGNTVQSVASQPMSVELLTSWIRWTVSYSLPLVVMIAMIVVAMFVQKTSFTSVASDARLITFGIGYAVSSILMLCIGVMSERAASFYFACLLLFVLRFATFVRIPARIVTICQVMALSVIVMCVVPGYLHTATSARALHENQALFVQSGSENKVDVKATNFNALPGVVKRIGARFSTDVDHNQVGPTKYWVQGWMSQYYGVKDIDLVD